MPRTDPAIVFIFNLKGQNWRFCARFVRCAYPLLAICIASDVLPKLARNSAVKLPPSNSAIKFVWHRSHIDLQTALSAVHFDVAPRQVIAPESSRHSNIHQAVV